MKKLVLSFFFLLCSLFCFGQTNDKSLEYYEAGNKATAEKNYQLADSLYTLSLQLKPHPDTYYNRAMVRKKLGNTEWYCLDIEQAAALGDVESMKWLWGGCATDTTIYYDKDNQPMKDSANYAFAENKQQCIYSKGKRYTKWVRKRGIIDGYRIVHSDSIHYEGDSLKNNLVEQPEFPGGEARLMQFLKINVKYPITERDNGIQGKVYLSYIVDADGNVTEATILKGIDGGPGCNKEALRVIGLMPKWKPGIQNGKPVRCKFILPVTFKLQ